MCLPWLTFCENWLNDILTKAWSIVNWLNVILTKTRCIGNWLNVILTKARCIGNWLNVTLTEARSDISLKELKASNNLQGAKTLWLVLCPNCRIFTRNNHIIIHLIISQIYIHHSMSDITVFILSCNTFKCILCNIPIIFRKSMSLVLSNIN